eukprot:TRINITY_DN1484_c1_g3_i2.p1 TRINITY_DN1484_c1_g3~~TRINITY_DN1484_c1_g3_i2.p1  ORF type:complete len:1838 (+),score=402.93 TRINITY_DN1484_c1_g3_i2:53-5515(+)
MSSSSSLVPVLFDAVSDSHVKWLEMKDRTNGHDMFLLGPPGSYRRKIALRYCELANREVEHLVISRDTTEADLKQRKEIVRGQGTIYVDSAPIRAAMHGRILLLDGIEKAERNVLPTLNNLLENREVQLDDGRFLMHHTVYDGLVAKMGVEKCKERGLVRVHENFRVIALGLPVPPFQGAPLDPPLRSRFQARFVSTEAPDALAAWPRLGAAIEAINMPPTDGRPRPPCVSWDACQRMLRLLSIPLPGRPSPASVLHRMYPIHHLNTDPAAKENALSLIKHFGLLNLDIAPPTATSFDPRAGEVLLACGGTTVAMHSHCVPPTADPSFIYTDALQSTFSGVAQDFALGHDVCLMGGSGTGKSHFAREIASRLGYGSNVEYMFMYGDMTARDLVQRRITDSEGNTRWNAGPVIKAAREGSLLILDGVNRVPGDLLTALAPLLHERQLQLHADTGEDDVMLLRSDRRQAKGGNGSAVHPRFRVLALACPPTAKDSWMTEEFLTLFSFHDIPQWTPESLAKVIGSLHVSLDVKTILPSLVALTKISDSDLPPLSLRQLLRASNAAAHGNRREARARAADSVARQLLIDSLPDMHRVQLLARLEEAFGTPTKQIVSTEAASRHLSIARSPTKVTIGEVLCPVNIPVHPERVPKVTFVEIQRHLEIMEGLAREFFIQEEKYLMLLGPQGVGKNRITDYLLQNLGWERMYMQLHRDTTIQQLTATPQLTNGVLTWTDSPLVTAAKEGLCLVLDEADKAPLEVIVLLKSLVEDGQLALSDGRKLVRTANPMVLNNPSVVPVHPSFRMIVLANRPGFPFLGNDLFRECGDVFSVYCLDNADQESELQLLLSEAPSVDPVILRRLVQAFYELRKLNATGRIAYPYSTRELLHIARHMQAHPNATIGDALNNVLSFDRMDPVAMIIKPVFERHGIPVSDVLSGEIDKRSTLPAYLRAKEVLSEVRLSPNVNLGPAVPTGTATESTRVTLCPKPIGCSGGMLSCEPPLMRPIKDLAFHRAKGFSEYLMTFKLSIRKNMRDGVIDATMGHLNNERFMFILTEQPAAVWVCPDPLSSSSNMTEAATIRWGGFGGGAVGQETITINGRVVTSGQGQIARTQNGKIVVVYIPGDAAQLIAVTMPEKGYTGVPGMQQIRLPHLLFRGRKNPSATYFMVEVKGHNIDQNCMGASVTFQPKDLIIMVSRKDKKLVAVDVRRKVYREVVLETNDIEQISAEARDSVVIVTTGTHTIRFAPCLKPGVQSDIDVTEVRYSDAAISPPLKLNGLLAAGSGRPFYGNTMKKGSKDIFGWARDAASASLGHDTMEATRSTVCYGNGNNSISVLDINKEYNATWKTVPRFEGSAGEIICMTSTIDPIEGEVLVVITSEGLVACVQATEKKLLPSLVTYLRIRGVGAYVDEALKQRSKEGSGQQGQGVTTTMSASELVDRIESIATTTQKRIETKHDKDREASGKPKHGKEDGKKHVGGNQFAGGSGGSDTAGMGGKAGPYRLDRGHDVHQISDEAKKNVSKEAAEAAKKMGKEAFEKRLKEIEMGDEDYALYKKLLGTIEPEINTMRGILRRVEAASRERVWLKGTEGEIDDNKIVDAKAGETTVFRRRADKKPQPGVQIKPKRLVFLFDVSASMYRFNGLDGRLRCSMECAVMLMEAMQGFETRFEWTLLCHSGDGPDHVMVPFGKPPKNESERLKIVQKMSAHAQYCGSGDCTLEGLHHAASVFAHREATHGVSDEKIVLAFSDANMDRYGITSEGLEKALRAGKNVHSSIFFLTSSDGEAERITSKITPGLAYIALDLKNLPTMIKTVFTNSLTKAARSSAL